MIRINGEVEKIEERIRVAKVYRIGDPPYDRIVTEEESLGWFATIKGSYMSFRIGESHHGINVGDPVTILIGKFNNARN